MQPQHHPRGWKDPQRGEPGGALLAQPGADGASCTAPSLGRPSAPWTESTVDKYFFSPPSPDSASWVGVVRAIIFLIISLLVEIEARRCHISSAKPNSTLWLQIHLSWPRLLFRYQWGLLTQVHSQTKAAPGQGSREAERRRHLSGPLLLSSPTRPVCSGVVGNVNLTDSTTAQTQRHDYYIRL